MIWLLSLPFPACDYRSFVCLARQHGACGLTTTAPCLHVPSTNQMAWPNHNCTTRCLATPARASLYILYDAATVGLLQQPPALQQHATPQPSRWRLNKLYLRPLLTKSANCCMSCRRRKHGPFTHPWGGEGPQAAAPRAKAGQGRQRHGDG
jgi:hypothetical protein